MTAAAAFTGCSAEKKEEIAYVPPEVGRYENPIEIEGQWGASDATGPDGQYGIGDPFVMRYNGKYYLYPSTSDPCDGIKVFESDDLVNWTYRGYAVSDSEATSHGAYAPEVVYYNGYFYLCQSRGGNGHYIYRSESPTEGFELISTSARGEGDIDYGNIGLGIDGSFYVSDDGKLYLLHTSTPAGLKYNEITDVSDVNPDTLGDTGELGTANLDHWIEGPGIFRRGGFSYLTYTGNHVLSSGYRVAYSYAEDLTDLSSFIQPADNVTIIDTDAEHRGLGHASNFNGPDLDSVYTAYHSLVGRGPARRYNLDRYFASGSILTANGVTHRPVAVPAAPDKGGYAEALRRSGGAYVFGETGGYFTAEYNFVPSDEQEIFFGRTENAEYTVRAAGGKISLTLTRNGQQTLLGEKPVVLPEGKLATVRIENGDGVGHVYCNGMRVVSYEAASAAGETGYASAEGVGYTAFTNDVFGTSDFEALKNFPTKFPAVSYLKGEMRGFSIAKAARKTGGVRVGEKESTVRVGDAYAVALDRGDWVKYAIDVPSDGTYYIAAEVTAASAGAQIAVEIGEQRITAAVPAAPDGSETVRVYLGNIGVRAGIGTMKAEVVSGRAEVTLFEAGETNASGSVSVTDFERVNGSAETDGGALTVRGDYGAGYWNNTDCVNFEAVVTFSCSLSVGTNLGFMIRSSDYSYFSNQPAESWRGYYLQLSQSLVTLKKYDYGDRGAIGVARTGSLDLGGGVHTLTIRAEGHSFTVSVDNAVTFTASDACAFMKGRLGIYVGSGELTVHSLDYKRI